MNLIKQNWLLFCLLSTFLICLVPPILYAQVPASNPQADAYRAHAQELLTKSDFPGAITEYQKAYDLDKTGPTPFVAFDLFNIGSLYYSSNQYAKSIEVYQQSIPLWQQLGDKPSEAKALNNIGLDYQTLHQYDKALASYQLALPLERQNTNKTIPDKINEAASLHNMGEIYLELHQYDKALESFQQALALWQQLNDTTSEATTLSDAGLANAYLSQYDKALEFYQQALVLWQKLGNQSNEASTLNKIGLVYDKQSQYDKALTSYQQALTIIQQVRDIKDEAETLSSMGAVYQKINQNAKALDIFQLALKTFRKLQDKEGQANTLNKIGETYDDLNQSNKALVYYAQALTLYQQIGDRNGEATAILNTGYAYDSLSQYTKALDCENKALKIFQHLGNKSSEANAFLSLGVTSVNLSQYQQALHYYNQALTIFQKLGDKANAAKALQNIGNVYNYLGQHVKELDFYNQAFPFFREANDKNSEAAVLMNIGNSYDSLSKYAKALDYYSQSLTLFRKISNKKGIDLALIDIGTFYDNQGEYNKALDYYSQAQQISHNIMDEDDEAKALINIGTAYYHQQRYSKSLDTLAKALAIFQRDKNKDGEATAHLNIGFVYQHLKQYDKALKHYTEALHLFREIEKKNGEAITLMDIGSLYERQRQKLKSLKFYTQSLSLFRAMGDRTNEAQTLSDLMVLCRDGKTRNAAILFGKQSVNIFQSIRGENIHLSNQLQGGYVKSKEQTYRFLAGLLIVLGRLSEAQQIIHILKEREYFDFLNPDPNTPLLPIEHLVFTKREKNWIIAYHDVAKLLNEIGNQEQGLHLKKNRTKRENAKLVRLKAQMNQLTKSLNDTQKQIAKTFSYPITASIALPDAVEAQDVQRALPHGTAALYTIVAPDKIYLLLITPNVKRVYSSKIKTDTLYKKVFSLRKALFNPSIDPTSPAAELYHLILEPVQNELDAEGTTRILFSLDDALRYVPPAALYNPKTKQYIAEQYQTELITLTGTKPAASKTARLTILGMGVSTPQDGAPSLPGVKEELTSIIHEPGDKGGLIPGLRLLNAQFTQAALEHGLKTRHYPIVHLASHFSLSKTQDTSYLLLGDGHHITIADLAKDPDRFQGIELLTLSACQTAMEVRGSTGREVEGIGVLAQTLGAKSVLASLWPVSDKATPLFMTALYAYRKQHPASSLAEALRATQLFLLHKPMPKSFNTANRGVEMLMAPREKINLPRFKTDANKPYAHPFYWAPFVLIGNWR